MSQKGQSKPLVSKKYNNILSNHDDTQHAANSSITNPPIIGITAFAEEISTLKKFFAHIPAQTGIAFVVSHPEPRHEHRLIESLQSDTRLQVCQATNEMKIRPDCVYIPPSGFDLAVHDGAIRLTQRSYLSDDSFSFPVGIALNETGADSTLELIDFEKKLLEINSQLSATNAELITYIKAIGKLALVSVTDHCGTITEVNDIFCQVSGYNREELVGQTHSILESGIHSETFFAEMWQTITGGKVWHKEICNRTKNGELYWVDAVIVPLEDENGRIERYISVRVDISGRKQKETQLIEQLKEKGCLYAIHRDMVKATSLQKLCYQIIKHLISTMRFPEIAACHINLFDETFTSENYRDDLSNRIAAKIKVNGKTCGQLQVFYTEDKPFILPDEQNLLNFVAEDLGIWYERRNHEQHINHLACHDALTGLPNRLLLQDRITQALEFNQRHHGMIAVLFIDLDNFKNINDTFGHNLGDLLLKKVAKRLSASIRSEDTVARQGGDEFIVVLPYITETNVVELVSQKILTQLSEPYHINQHEFYLTCSIGIALYPEHGKDADVLLKHSDTAMYNAKSSGRNSYRYFSDEMNLQAIENHKITNYLYTAIKENELQLYFQPIVDIDNRIASLEVLLRWHHPKENWIPPTKFIPLAEESGLILPLGDWIIKSICLQIKEWLNDGYDVPKISINLSAKQFQHKLFLPNIQHILQETGVAAHNLILEITESLLMKDNEMVKKTLRQLSSLGFVIAIDDFGTGYSSLAYLKNYPINNLKIDRSFIRDITTDENDAAIVTATIGMAHSLGMKVVAEGVETERQVAFLNEKNCDLYQGFYFGVPMPAAKIATVLIPESTQAPLTLGKY
jgi:diguanylate cyclase (GGDEF)-like protein/PAS domain S-box-containing protein